MVSLGMSLRPADFKRVVVYPKGIAIGLANLLLLSPLLAFAVAEVYGLDPELAVGLVLLGASPGGTLANLLTHLGRGDTALSITMTATSSVAAVVTIPLFLKLGISHFGATGLDTHVGLIGLVARVLLITVVPMAFGMWLRARRPQRVADLGGAFQESRNRPLPRGGCRGDHRRAQSSDRQPGGGRGGRGHAQPRRNVLLIHGGPRWRDSTTGRRRPSRWSWAFTTRRWQSRSERPSQRC